MTDALPLLTPVEETVLLDLARRVVAARLESGRVPRLENPPPRLLVPQGAFVSLHLGRALRGCVGMVMPVRPLATTVTECAAAAATEDPRFDPLQPSDLERVTIEISALDPPFRIADPSRLTLGTHGLMVTMGHRRGLLLPQVAVEQGWTVLIFLEETCLKAGLPPDAWERGAIVEAFSAQVFAERNRPLH
jgi:AmmeMemoRadiSam system protein A